MGVDSQMLPPDPIQEEPTYEGALAAFEALDPIRILFDNGAGGDPGKPNPGFEQSFPSSRSRARRRARGTSRTAASCRTTRPAAREPTRSRGTPRSTAADGLHDGDTAAGENGLWTATPAYEWQQKPEGNAVSYLTEPLGENTTVIGAGAVHAWVRSSKPTVDLQATITEVRPDGKETFVQSGWVRGEDAQARQGEEHAARAGPEPARAGHEADAARALRQGRDPALLPGPRLPRRFADPRDDQRPERRPADLGVRRDAAEGQEAGERGDRVLQEPGRRA